MSRRTVAQVRSEAARKAWATRRRNARELARKRSRAAVKAWQTRRRNVVS